MNPFDTVNNDTKENTSSSNLGKKQSNQSNSKKKNDNKIKSQKKNRNNKPQKKTIGKQSHKKFSDQSRELNNKYSTARLSVNDVLRLKILQSITGYKSRSDLVNEMIKIVKPVLLNSKSDTQQYKKLYNYAITGWKINNKFKN